MICKTRLLLSILLFNALLCGYATAQETKQRLKIGASIEVYGLEYYDNGSMASVRYCGQTLSGTIGYDLGRHWRVGASAGIYYHQRVWKGTSTFHVFAPLQLTCSFHTLNERFQVEIASGYPVQLKEATPFIGRTGFWYREQYPDPMDYPSYKAHVRKPLHLMSNLRVKFQLKKHPQWYITAGIRHLVYSTTLRYYNNSGTAYFVYPGQVFGPYHYFDASFGLEYRFK
jgi:hypothetical protein